MNKKIILLTASICLNILITQASPNKVVQIYIPENNFQTYTPEDNEEKNNKDSFYQSPFTFKRSSFPLSPFLLPSYWKYLTEGVFLASVFKLGYTALSNKSIQPIKQKISGSFPKSNRLKVLYGVELFLESYFLNLKNIPNVPIHATWAISTDIAYNILSDGKHPHIRWSNVKEFSSTLFSRWFWTTPYIFAKRLVSYPVALGKTVYNKPSTLGWLTLGTAASFGLEQLFFSSKIFHKNFKIKQLAKNSTIKEQVKKIQNLPGCSNCTGADLATVYLDPQNSLLSSEWNTIERLKESLQIKKVTIADLKLLYEAYFATIQDKNNKEAFNNYIIILTEISNRYQITSRGGPIDALKELVASTSLSLKKALQQCSKEANGLYSEKAKEIATHIAPFWNTKTSDIEKINTIRRILFVLDKKATNHMINLLSKNQKNCTCYFCKKWKKCLVEANDKTSETLTYESALEILGFKPNSKPNESDVEKAFRKKSMRWHPDRCQGNTEAEKAGCKKKFIEIYAARKFLLENQAQNSNSDQCLHKERLTYCLLAQEKTAMSSMYAPICFDCWVEIYAHALTSQHAQELNIENPTTNENIEENIQKYNETK